MCSIEAAFRPVKVQFRLLLRLARRVFTDRFLGDVAGVRYVATTALGGEETAGELEELGVMRLSSGDLGLRSADTLFILGSAPDVNRLSEEQWEVISRYDSVGFNSWARHPFVPTFYFAQDFPEDISQRLVSADYLNTCVILRGDGIARQGLSLPGLEDFLARCSSQRIRFMPEIPVGRWAERISPAESLELLGALGLWHRSDVPRLMPKFRSTLGLAVAFGYAMGYERIVVCGSDPMTPGHFWDAPEESMTARFACRWDYLRSDLWTHESRLFAPNTVSSYLRAIDEDLRVSGGGGVYSGNVAGPRHGLRNFWADVHFLGEIQ